MINKLFISLLAILFATFASANVSSGFASGMYGNVGLTYDSTMDYTETNDTEYTGSEVMVGM